MTSHITRTVEDGVCTLCLDRAERRNALTADMVETLTAELRVAAEEPEVRLVVLRGAGQSFCTGLDLDEFYQAADATGPRQLEGAARLRRLFATLHACPKATLAVIQGRALGVGATLAISADVVIASSNTELAFPEVTFGFLPAFASVLLRRLTGPKAAFELAATGRTVHAEEARALGLISRVIPENGFDAVTGSAIRQLCACATEMLGSLKTLFRELEGTTFEEGLAVGEAWNARAHGTAAFREAARQFLEMA